MNEQRHMNESERERCKQWIQKHLTEHPRKKSDSYVLKHMFENMTGIYSGDKEFQDVMRECGIESIAEHESLFNVRIDSAAINVVYK